MHALLHRLVKYTKFSASLKHCYSFEPFLYSVRKPIRSSMWFNSKLNPWMSSMTSWCIPIQDLEGLLPIYMQRQWVRCCAAAYGRPILDQYTAPMPQAYVYTVGLYSTNILDPCRRPMFNACSCFVCNSIQVHHCTCVAKALERPTMDLHTPIAKPVGIHHPFEKGIKNPFEKE